MGTSRRQAVSIAVATALVSGDAIAQPPDVASQAGDVVAPGAAAPLPVRLSLSPAAAEYLTEVRVRSLLVIELSGATTLEAGPVGPLDRSVVRVWVDLPQPSTVLVQVDAPDRALVTRTVDIAGLEWDVAARLTAIATSVAVRKQLKPRKKPAPPAPVGPTPEELERARRAAPTVRLLASGGTALVTGDMNLLGGPDFRLGMQGAGIEQAVGARLYAADTAVGMARYLEGFVSGGVRGYATDALRLHLGASVGIAQLAPPAVSASWTSRAGLDLGLAVEVAEESWLGLFLEPGVLLTPAEVGATAPLEGGFLGIRLGFESEIPLRVTPPS